MVGHVVRYRKELQSTLRRAAAPPPSGRGATGVVLVGESDLEFLVEWCAEKEGLSYRAASAGERRPARQGELVICSERLGFGPRAESEWSSSDGTAAGEPCAPSEPPAPRELRASSEPCAPSEPGASSAGPVRAGEATSGQGAASGPEGANVGWWDLHLAELALPGWGG